VLKLTCKFSAEPEGFPDTLSLHFTDQLQGASESLAVSLDGALALYHLTAVQVLQPCQPHRQRLDPQGITRFGGQYD
jgi:hypothetical protein